MTPLTPMRLGILACLGSSMVAGAQTPANPPAPKVIESITFKGVHREPQEAMMASIETKVGDVYNEGSLRRDLTILWKTCRFTDIQVKTEPGAHGGVIVRFEMTERPAQSAANLIEGIEFRGLSSVTQDAMKSTIESKVGEICDGLALRRDLAALWETNRFENVQVKTEAGPGSGTIIRFILTERQ